MRVKLNKVMVIKRDYKLPPIQGEDAIAAAFEKKDLGQLKLVLSVHPESWQTELSRMNRTHSSTRYEGNTVHFALQHGWAKALGPLHEAGASLQEAHQRTGYTPLQMAAYCGYPIALRWLIAHKAAQSAEEIQKALSLVVLGANRKSKKLTTKSCAETLTKLGATPWGLGRNNDMLPVECLKKGYPYLAVMLIDLGDNPPPQDGTLAEAWVKNLNHGSPEDHAELLNALFNKGLAPDLRFLSKAYAALGEWTDTGTIIGNEKTNLQRLKMLVRNRLELGIDPQDALQTAEILRPRPEMMDIVSKIEQEILDHRAPKSTAMGSRRTL